MIRRALIPLLAALAFVACGGEEPTRSAAAVEAQEGNEVRLGDLTYRVVSFRELNAAVVADRSLVGALSPAPRHGLYAAFIRVCNRGAEPVKPAAAFRLEDAFGTAYAPLHDGVDPDLAYSSPEQLAPGDCEPATGSVAERTFDGAALVFEVPYAITQERPLSLEIRASGRTARMELDL